jgi:3-phosphoshikimate 1-carboxyvinyltransferase
MKSKIKIKNKKTICGEVVGDIEAKSSNLKATVVYEKMAPRLIDEYPILFIAACFAKGTSNFKGIEELRVKESDRIKSMEDGLKPLGVKISSTKSSAKITGTSSFKLNKQIKIDAKGDHRIAMSFYVLSQVLNKSFKIKDFNYVKTSFPSFTKTINQLKKN